jgi:hypothetical protein
MLIEKFILYYFISKIIFFEVRDSKGTGAGAEDIYEPALWYYDLLLFTAQSEIGRKGKSNYDDNSDSDIVAREMNDVSRISLINILLSWPYFTHFYVFSVSTLYSAQKVVMIS